jgi:hypothetical protein
MLKPAPALLLTVALLALCLMVGCGSNPTHPANTPQPSPGSPTPSSPTPSPSSSSITGKVVDATTNQPVSGTVAVALETGPGDFSVVSRTTADAHGNFSFSNVAAGGPYAIVVEALNSQNVLYVPSIVVSGSGPFTGGTALGPGTNVGTISLHAPSPTSATELLSGVVSSTNASGAPVSIDVTFDATTFVADFVFIVPNPSSTPVTTSTACSGGAGACADFNVTVPAQTAYFAVFNSSGMNLQPFSSGPDYGLIAHAFSVSSSQPDCSPSTKTVAAPFATSPGAVLTTSGVQFTGCQ